jgi:hypothetical protein
MSEQTSAPSKVRTLPVLATVIVVAACLAMVLATAVVATPISAPAGSSGVSTALTPANSAVQTWAYGGTKSISGDITVTGSNGNGFELQYHAFYGWTVVFTQTNNSTNSGFMLEAQRTAGAQLYVNLCSPNCTAPTWKGNYTATASELDTAFGNFTRQGTVYVNSGSDPTATQAIGFLNGSGATQDALHSHLTVTSTKVTNWWFNVTASAQAQVYFNPELGLIPEGTLTPGETWNSTAAYNLTGSYALDWSYVGPLTQASGNPSGTFSLAGTVDLLGAYSQDVTLHNGEHTHVLLLTLAGPFDVRDGVIILPHIGNVFSGDPVALGGKGLGFAPVDSTAAVDYNSGNGRIAAAATAFGPGVSGAVPSTTLAAMASSPSGGQIQAQPMTVPAAQSCAASLLKGGDCSPTSGGGINIGPFHATFFDLVALIAGVVVLVAVLAVAVGRRPRAPPPVRVPRSSSPVPPGAGGQLAPPPRAPPQQPSDPLGNLW